MPSAEAGRLSLQFAIPLAASVVFWGAAGRLCFFRPWLLPARLLGSSSWASLSARLEAWPLAFRVVTWAALCGVLVLVLLPLGLLLAWSALLFQRASPKEGGALVLLAGTGERRLPCCDSHAVFSFIY